MQGLDLNLFFFREKFRSFVDFEQMSGLWSMFWFKSFRKIFRKIAIFRNFNHWSEILSLSADRPISQDVCPPLAEIFPSQGAPPVSLPPVSMTPVANGRRYQRHRRQICHRYQRHRRQILPPVPLVLLTPVAKFATGVNDAGGK
jgi:hypothetical protein